MSAVLTKEFLRQRQSLPLAAKISMTLRRIREWLDYWEARERECYVAFSGGKDSAVLLHLARQIDWTIPAVFVNTGLEHPLIIDFVRTIEGVVWVRPKIPFHRVVAQYGVPLVSKKVCRYVNDLRGDKNNAATRHLRMTGCNRKGEFCPSMKLPAKWLPLVDAPFSITDKCCHILKKEPLRRYARETGRVGITAMMASESNNRERSYLQNGCNLYNAKDPISNPMSFWVEQDVLQYITENKLPISAAYGEIVRDGDGWRCTGEQRTGCMFCGFGAHLEKSPNRFERMAQQYPKRHQYCMYTLGMRVPLEFIGVKTGC